MKRKNILFLLLALVFVACSKHSNEFERILVVADSLMNHEQADSAYRMLCSMNVEAESLPHAQRMRYLLLRSNAQNKAGVPFVSDSIGNFLVAYYDQYGTSDERMLAHYVKGCAYRDMQDQPSALRSYNDAVAVADTTRADCNFDQLSIIYGQIARIFYNRAMSENALEAYEMAESYAWKAKDTMNVFSIWGNKSNVLINKGDINEALRLKEAAAEGYITMGYPQKAARIKGQCIEWYAQQGMLGKAKAAMDDYEALSGYFKENGDVEPGREDYYHIKGTYYYERRQMDSAQYFFRKLQQDGRTRNDQYLAAWGLTRFYYWSGNCDSVAKYALQTLTHSDTLYHIGTAKSLQNTHAQYNYTRHLETAHCKELEAKDIQLRLYKWIVGSVLAAVMGFVFYLFLRRQIGQKRRELAVANKENEQLHTKIQKNTETIEVLNELVDTKNQKMAMLNERIAEKNHLIEELNKTISQNAADLQQNQQLKESVAILQKQVEAHKQEIRQMASARKQGNLQEEPAIADLMQMVQKSQRPDAAQWRNIMALVEDYYPGMLTLRQQHGISHAEYRLCILIKVGMELSDILFIEDTYHAHITNMRRRMLRKFGREGGAKEFDQFIASI